LAKKTGKAVTYRDAGVDIDAGNEAVSLMKSAVRSTFNQQVLGDLGSFGGLFEFDKNRFKKPVLVTEIGAFVKTQGDDRSHELDWFKNMLAVLNAWNVGYTDWVWRSDEHLDHGALHQGHPNPAGRLFLDALNASP